MIEASGIFYVQNFCQYYIAAAIGTMIDHQDEKFHYSPKERLAYGKNYRY